MSATLTPMRTFTCMDCGLESRRPGNPARCETCAAHRARQRKTDWGRTRDRRTVRACTSCGLASVDVNTRGRCEPCAVVYREQRRAERAPAPAGSMRAYHLARNYGISIEQYDEMLARQGGACAICGASEGAPDGRRLAVDHCHATGRVRGLLCNSCNIALGKFCDRPELLSRAAAYLETV